MKIWMTFAAAAFACGCAHLRTASFPLPDRITEVVVKDTRDGLPKMKTVTDPVKIAELAKFLDERRESWKPYRGIAPAPGPVLVQLYHEQALVQVLRTGRGEMQTGVGGVECHHRLSPAEEAQLLTMLGLEPVVVVSHPK